MGTGKSTIGHGLSKRLDWSFIDSDHEVVEAAGLSIPEIFALHGEEAFRDLETETLADLVHHSNRVIATGGGIIQRETNRRLIADNGFVVWLTASQEAILERVLRNRNRPLVQTADPAKTVQELLLQRDPLYQSIADLKVDTSLLSPGRIVSAILRALQ